MDGDGDATAGEATTSAHVEAPTSGGSTSDESSQVVEADEALLSRLALIEERPLADRAAVFRQLHDELRTELDATDGPGAEPTRPA